jgi:hypothetical protein
MKLLPDPGIEFAKFSASTRARIRELNANIVLDSSGMGTHDNDPLRKKNCLVYVMSYE